MNKFLIVCLVFVNVLLIKSSPLMLPHVAKIFSINQQDIENEWSLFKKIHNKNYKNELSELAR